MDDAKDVAQVRVMDMAIDDVESLGDHASATNAAGNEGPVVDTPLPRFVRCKWHGRRRARQDCELLSHDTWGCRSDCQCHIPRIYTAKKRHGRR